MKAIKDIPKKRKYRTFALMVIISLILFGCTKSEDDITGDIDNPDKEQSGGKKEDVYIDIDNYNNKHKVSLLGFRMYDNPPIINTGIGIGDFSYVPFEAEINENGDTKLSISMTYDGAANSYVLSYYKNMDKTIVVLPPEPEAVKILVQLKDANNDEIIANIDDKDLDYVHIKSMEFSNGSSALR
jgi:hypothetical protein